MKVTRRHLVRNLLTRQPLPGRPLHVDFTPQVALADVENLDRPETRVRIPLGTFLPRAATRPAHAPQAQVSIPEALEVPWSELEARGRDS